jgi:cytoskeletal protein RodZ
MKSEDPSQHAGWFTGRTRLITVVSIVAVGLAGATAVSANIGILDSASHSPVGNASVTGEPGTPSTEAVDVRPAEATATTAAAAATSPDVDPPVQQFAVDVAGTVAVAATDAGLRLDQVTPSPGWTWNLAQSDPTRLTVTMTNGTSTLEFIATTTADGNIAASVTEPIVAAAPPSHGGADQDDDEHDEHDVHDDSPEYEGGEDDD